MALGQRKRSSWEPQTWAQCRLTSGGSAMAADSSGLPALGRNAISNLSRDWTPGAFPALCVFPGGPSKLATPGLLTAVGSGHSDADGGVREPERWNRSLRVRRSGPSSRLFVPSWVPRGIPTTGAECRGPRSQHPALPAVVAGVWGYPARRARRSDPAHVPRRASVLRPFKFFPLEE